MAGIGKVLMKGYRPGGNNLVGPRGESVLMVLTEHWDIVRGVESRTLLTSDG